MLNERIRELRTKNNLSQATLGAKLNLTQQAIAKWEKGISEPDSENINKLADLFSVTTDYLLGKINSTDTAAGEKETFPGAAQEKEALEIVEALEKMGLLNFKEDLAPQIQALLKFIESNKDFIRVLSQKQ